MMPKNLPGHYTMLVQDEVGGLESNVSISDRGDFWGIITVWDPSVCKSNRLHVDILRVFLY